MTPDEFTAMRETLGLTQARLGEILGLERRQISRIENGAAIKPAYAMALRYLALQAA